MKKTDPIVAAQYGTIVVNFDDKVTVKHFKETFHTGHTEPVCFITNGREYWLNEESIRVLIAAMATVLEERVVVEGGDA